MYTVSLGRRLIAAHNKREDKNRNPRQFFDEVYFPLFFQKERFLQHVNNSPIDQASKQAKKTPLTQEILNLSLMKIHDNVEKSGESAGLPDASLFVGGPARGNIETTSGQVTNLPINISSEDIYASWIGGALGIGIEGGLSLLIDNEELLLKLFDGWSLYRRLLDQTPILKGRQIDSWNGQWLAWRLGEDWNAHAFWAPQTGVDPKGQHVIVTQTWVQLLFSLAYYFGEENSMPVMAYVYKFGQTNQTVGFTQLDLPKINSLPEWYRSLFTVPEGMLPNAFKSLYETEFSFLTACSQGSIGLRALQPKGFRKYMPERGSKSVPARINLSHTAPEQQLSGQIYQTWIIAMLNNKDLFDRTEEMAQTLYTHARQNSSRSKSDHGQRVRVVLDTNTRRSFIEALTKIMEAEPESANAAAFNQIATDVMTLPESNVPLFLTLLRFKYAYVEKTSTPSISLP